MHGCVPESTLLRDGASEDPMHLVPPESSGVGWILSPPARGDVMHVRPCSRSLPVVRILPAPPGPAFAEAGDRGNGTVSLLVRSRGRLTRRETVPLPLSPDSPKASTGATRRIRTTTRDRRPGG